MTLRLSFANLIARTGTRVISAAALPLLIAACSGSQSSSTKVVETANGEGSGGNGAGAGDGDGAGSGATGPGGSAGRRNRGSSMNARIAMGVQTSSPISDHAQVVIDDGDGGVYLGHVVQRPTRTALNTRPRDRRLVMEGGEGAYLSHYDADYQRISRVILEDIHFVDAIARHPTTGDLFIAGQEHFYPKARKRTKLRLLHYRADGSKKSARFDRRLLSRIPRRALEHRVEDMVIDDNGNLYLGVTVVRKRKKVERGKGRGVAEMALVKMSARGRIRWYKKLSTRHKKRIGERADSSEIGALAVTPEGQLIAVGHTGNDIDRDNRNRGGLDIFLQVFDARSGKLRTTRTYGTEKRDVVRDLAIADDGTMILVGSTSGQMFASPRGDDDAIIMALDKRGEPLWSEQIGTGHTDRFQSVTITEKGAILVVGETDGQLALERPVAGGESSAMDVLVAGYSPQGVRSWMFQAGTAVNDYPADIASASQGGAHLLFDTQGSFQGMGQPGAAAPAKVPQLDVVLLRLRD